MNIYPIIQFDIYIYIYKLCVFCLLKQSRNTYAHWSYWSHTHITFPSCFYLIIVTSRNSLPNCGHDLSYQ